MPNNYLTTSLSGLALSFRSFCFFTLLFASIFRGRAQTLSVPAASAGPAFSASLTRANTARAVHELFRSRRGGGLGWLAFGTAGVLASTLPAQQTTSAGVWTPGVVAGVAFIALGVKKRVQFRPGRERQLLRELTATGHLPASVSRRLHGNFAPVHGTASAVNFLLAYGITPSATVSAAAPTPA